MCLQLCILCDAYYNIIMFTYSGVGDLRLHDYCPLRTASLVFHMAITRRKGWRGPAGENEDRPFFFTKAHNTHNVPNWNYQRVMYV